MIHEHEYKSPDANGKRWCMHCGVLLDPTIAKTCVGRPGDTPTRGWLGSALDDTDAIFNRLDELRKERPAVTDAPEPSAEPAKMSEEDLMCG